jgi:hypothetical protein
LNGLFRPSCGCRCLARFVGHIASKSPLRCLRIAPPWPVKTFSSNPSSSASSIYKRT